MADLRVIQKALSALYEVRATASMWESDERAIDAAIGTLQVLERAAKQGRSH